MLWLRLRYAAATRWQFLCAETDGKFIIVGASPAHAAENIFDSLRTSLKLAANFIWPLIISLATWAPTAVASF
jgi:hypothetical protein